MRASWLDVIVLIVIGLFVIRNTWIGFFRGLSSLLGIALGVIVAGHYHPRLSDLLSPWVNAKWLHLVAYILTFFLVFLAVFIVAELLRRLFHSIRLSWVDRLLGFFLGLAKGVLLIAMIFMLLATFYPQSQRLFRHSFTYPYIVSGARFLITLCPESWRARFNYNLRHFFHEGYHRERP